MQASRITPPMRGSRREGGARSRAGGGQTPRPVSKYQRPLGGIIGAAAFTREVAVQESCPLAVSN